MHIEVSVSNQTLDLIEAGKIIRTYPISTSKYGLGTEEGSNRTPLGRFVIGEKIGDGAEERTIFRSREPVGVWDPSEVTEKDMVLSRILWLDGIDGDNGNTKDRYIYIHGTNDEGGIGKPCSDGCVRMRNSDVVDLFDRVAVSVEVRIIGDEEGE